MLDGYNGLTPKEREAYNDNMSAKTVKRYLSVYEDYVIHGYNIYELAEKYDMLSSNIKKIIKWATSQLPESDKDEVIKELTIKAQKRQKDIQNLLPTAGSTYEKLAIYRELRMADTYISQVKGVMKNVIVDNSKISNTINFIHSVIDRRSGKVIESNNEKVIDVNSEVLKGKRGKK